ncbi:MAG: XRE family transcriptional regulator [Tychonema bourrellyi B0820]|nr:XRE family transcriptional regulator [Tychonema bourrellyi]MDQ2096614.1 XRE family transcriptional regulator [Tychonema bourrellyi B0820]
MTIKPIRWVGAAREEIQSLPEDARKEERMRTMTENTITQANDNIFLDLGFSAQEADNLLIRSQLMLALQNQIKHHGWTIDQTAQHLKQSSDQIKALTQGKIGQFSVDTLIIMLNQVGMTVKVEICPKVA